MADALLDSRRNPRGVNDIDVYRTSSI